MEKGKLERVMTLVFSVACWLSAMVLVWFLALGVLAWERTSALALLFFIMCGIVTSALLSAKEKEDQA